MPFPFDPDGRIRLLGLDAKGIHDSGRHLHVEPAGSQPPVAVLDDVVGLPQYDALYDLQGNRIATTLRSYIPLALRPPKQAPRLARNDDRYSPAQIELPPMPLPIVKQTVVFGGVVWPHYGHFITDAMSRFWFLDQAEPAWPMLYLDRADRDYRATPYIAQTLAALGIGDPRRLLSLTRPTLFRRIVVPQPSIQGGFKLFHCHQAPHLQVAASMPAATTEFRGRRVYLSRTGLQAGLRQSADECRFEELLRRDDFIVVRPETLTLADQIALFESASVVAGSIGSAFHTALFSRTGSGLQLGVLTWGKPNGRYLMIDAIKRHRASYLRCLDIAALLPNERIEAVQIDIARAMDMLSDVGILARPGHRAAPAPPFETALPIAATTALPEPEPPTGVPPPLPAVPMPASADRPPAQQPAEPAPQRQSAWAAIRAWRPSTWRLKRRSG